MASTSDGMDPTELEPGIDFSSMRQPPLIKQLRGILSEYPDGGQILKELLQNAEDADATEVKILYDGRIINTEKGPDVSKYRKFFKGPALCVYNDALFTDKDWEGIRMIYSSVKEDDPLKVGRFGLGFKSVFHITDFPCVLSGDRLLMIDPQEQPDKVNAMIKVSRLDELEEEDFDSADLWRAFEGIFGLTKDSLTTSGKYQGTIFWFPLREEASKLSETLYDETKVLDLFDSLSSEASSLLLFLKNLEKVSVYLRGQEPVSLVQTDEAKKSSEPEKEHVDSFDHTFTKILEVWIEDTDGKVKQNRTKFKDKIKRLTVNYSGDDIGNEYVLTIKTRRTEIEETRWLVANYFVGKSATPEFRRLIEDENIVYSPYVGVAAPLEDTDQFEGHVFCFLPLPKEGSKLTGLPVHVNGFFALSQNRHHLKWETEEQKGKKIDDKSILWNKRLIQEAIPKAYDRLVNKMIEISKSEGNKNETVTAVYGCLPNTESTKKNWKFLEEELFKKLKKKKFLYCEPKDSWVTAGEACFATFHGLPADFENVKGAVIDCLNRMGKSHVSISEKLLKTVTGQFKSVQILSPKTLSDMIRQQPSYKNMQDEDKLMLLAYLLSDKRFYESVVEIELLPLASGKWINFKKKSETIYLCSDEEVKVLRGMENKLCKKSVLCQTMLADRINQICQKGTFQMKEITSAQMAVLLKETIEVNLGPDPVVTRTSKLSFDWLKDLWRFIAERNFMKHFRDIKIFPVLHSGTWDEPDVANLVTISEKLLVKSSHGKSIPGSVCRCFQAMRVTVVDCLPEWIPKEHVKHDLFWPSPKSIFVLLEQIVSQSDVNEVIKNFNSTCDSKDKAAFVGCLGKCSGLSESSKVRTFLRLLEIFPTARLIKQPGPCVSISQISIYTLMSEDFPDGVKFPFQCIIAETSDVNLLNQLGAKEIKSKELLLETLRAYEKDGFKTTDEFPKLMEFFIKRFHVYEKEDQIIHYAAKVPFLRTGEQRRRPSELFDPSDTFLGNLLYGENLLPETKKKLTGEQIKILKLLGLKSVDNINENILLDVAESLDRWARDGEESSQIERKAVAFLNVLSTKAFLLEETCRTGKSLKESIRSLACVPALRERPSYYPESLYWQCNTDILCRPDQAKEESLSLLVGAVLPVVKCHSQILNKTFGWKDDPAAEVVFDQLKRISGCFSIEERPDFMRPIKLVYEHLEERRMEVWQMKDCIKDANIVWNGSCFTTVSKIIVLRTENDLNLCPYFYTVPEDFITFQKLYEAFGCRQQQDISVLLETLKQIKVTHESQFNEQDLKRDRRTVCSILESVSAMKGRNLIKVDDSEILMMVRNALDPKALKLVPLPECTYDDDPTCYFEIEGAVNLVHEMIPFSVVEALGVKSISNRALNEAEDFGVEWGQSERLTTRLHTLIETGYKDGLSVPKELIQNADDAGAKTVKFLYDERQNLSCRTRVLSKGLKQFQGPALWVYNDEVFTPDDLQNITKLNAATKKLDEKKIGKFGLGFCAVYNVTDLPSFISGSSIVIFDPHEKYLGSESKRRGTGLRYQFPNRTLIARYSDQFSPFQNVFGCNILDEDYTEFKGSLFRLPLRTEQQAKDSQIYKRAYTKEEVTSLLQMLIEAAGDLILFTQHVEEVEVHHLPEAATSASQSKLIFRVSKKCKIIEETNTFRSENKSQRKSQSVLSRATDLLNDNGYRLEELHETVIRQEKYAEVGDLSLLSEAERYETSWVISWALGSKASLKMYQEKKADGAIPLAAVALPVSGDPKFPCRLKQLSSGFYREGHAFCFLPLPVESRLPVHLNACFAVNEHRNGLLSSTADDKHSNRLAWNDAILTDVIVAAYINLLKVFRHRGFSVQSSSEYFDLWPIECAPFACPLQRAFFENVLQVNVELFKASTSTWFPFEQVEFLETKLRNTDIGEAAFEMLSSFPTDGKTVIDMPAEVLTKIKQYNRSKLGLIKASEITEGDFYLRFLESLDTSYWNQRTEQRNKFIVRALILDNKEVTEKMRSMRCIPTTPNNILAKPSDLIHPTSKLLCSLFREEEERFPYKSDIFSDLSVLNRLVDLGMNRSSLPVSLVIDRCESITVLAGKCSSCAKTRIKRVLEYLSQQDLECMVEVVGKIKDMYIIPVLAKPSEWCFRWHAESEDADLNIYKPVEMCQDHTGRSESFMLGRASQMFRFIAHDLIGMVSLVVDEIELFDGVSDRHRFLQSIGVRGLKDVTLELLANQVYFLVEEYTDENQFKDVVQMYRRILTQMNKISSLEDSDSCLDQLRLTACILIGNTFVRPEQVAIRTKEECPPYLFRLPETDTFLNRNIYSKLGVKERFDIEAVLQVMDIVKQKPDDSSIEIVRRLLENLDDILEHAGQSYENFEQYHERIVAPDVTGKLFPTYKLVTENEDFRTSLSLKVLHPSVPPLLGQKLGVKVKQMRCFEEIRFGISFGQREKLVTRIKGLLKAYPCDFSIMKELLQNADDAGATEIHFVKDYRVHSKENLFKESCEPLQGPALCVYNNSYFTRQDIEGIHNLGQGSKSDDPTKTGQYGVGFNAVYHLTDTPSFLTKGPGLEGEGLLFVFDPLCQHVPQATIAEPGLMCKVEDVQENFPNQLLGFSLNQLLPGSTGTLFRFPLRSTKSEISEEILKTENIDTLLKDFEKDMLDAVLFLKSVRKIKVSNISSGFLEHEYTATVQVEPSFEEKLKVFNRITLDTAKRNEERKARNLDTPHEIIYPLKVLDSRNTSKQWLIIQRFGLAEGYTRFTSLLSSFKTGDLGLLPVGGVAIPLGSYMKGCIGACAAVDNEAESTKNQTSNSKTASSCPNSDSKFCGKAFCFLPLPIVTGLPLHVNGHFALDHESRRNLWNEGYRHEWNQCLAEFSIVPCWISGLVFLIEQFTPKLELLNAWRKVNAFMDEFFALFPAPKTAISSIWNETACLFYKQSLQNEIAIFPSVCSRKDILSCPDFRSNNDGRVFSVEWTAIKTDTEKLKSGVFNTVLLSLPDWYSVKQKDTESCTVISLLKSFGMKILETPLTVKKYMKEAGIADIPCTSPSMVADFLQSKFCDTNTLQPYMERQISESNFQSPENLYVFMHFLLLDINCHKKLQGLPLALTADNVVRIFSEAKKLFVSPFLALLPNSRDLFIHAQIEPLLNNSRVLQSGCLQEFSFQTFLTLLPQSMDPSIYAAGAEIHISKKETELQVSKTICVEWLALLFDFLYDSALEAEPVKPETSMPYQTTMQQEKKKTLNHGKFSEELESLETWSLLPCLKDKGQHLLVPVNQKQFLLHLSFIDKGEKYVQALEKLSLPTVYTAAFRTCRMGHEIRSAVEKIVASPEQPMKLLKCLGHYLPILRASKLSAECGTDILGFFERKLEVLKSSENTETVVRLLSQLPLYVTQQGSLTSLDDGREVIVLPKGMPQAGVQAWANSCNITLLQEKESLTNLYQYLGLKSANIDYVYGHKILPQFQALPNISQNEHITFLKNRLGSFCLSSDQVKIIEGLKKLAFLDVRGKSKRANELFDPRNEVFAVMKTESDFPPKEYMLNGWDIFLEKLGLIKEVNDDMMLCFAKQIEASAKTRVDEKLKCQSRTLFFCFCQHGSIKWNKRTIKALRTIEFLEPFVVENVNHALCSQPKYENKLICLYESVSSKVKSICWTTVNLIDEDRINKLNVVVCKKLHVRDSPPLEKVIEHCENVCLAVKKTLHKGCDTSFIKTVMIALYEYFDSCADLTAVKQKLRTKPFVHLPEENDIVSLDTVVPDLPTDMQIKPYLYRASPYYGKYFKLFERLGSRSNVMFCHYANILSCIKETAKSRELNPPERQFVKQAFLGILKLDMSTDESVSVIQELYLPTKGMVLMNSSQLVVSNNPAFEKRLSSNISIPLCADNSFLGKKTPLIEEEITKWPKHLKPVLLTDVVKEKVSLGTVRGQQMLGSIKARKLQNFLHSDELCIGLCRLLKHQFVESGKASDFNANVAEVEISARLRNVRVIQLASLRTVLKYNGSVVKGSERNIACYVQREADFMSGPCTIFFKDVSTSDRIDVTSISLGLSGVITACAGNIDVKSTICVSAIVSSVASSSRIADILDQHGVTPYHAVHCQQKEYFPKPGTYVESKFIPFLEQSIEPFKDYEYDYVAMELEDASIDNKNAEERNPVYIYVRIIHEVSSANESDVQDNDLRRVYLVETGNTTIPSEEVPIYRLYRFVRKEISDDKDVELLAETSQTDNLPFDEQCRILREQLREAFHLPEKERKSVVKRILLQWHPDKNHGKEEYCTKIFQYIQVVLSRLENNESLIHDANEEMSRGPSRFSRESSAFYEFVFKRAKTYARAYHDNYESYCKSERMGHFSHEPTEQPPERRDFDEATRWLRQAKCDYQIANTMKRNAENANSNNWVCFVCYQASENALRAACYTRDANKMPSGEELSNFGTTPEMIREARSLQMRIGNPARARYPEQRSRPRIPSEIFTSDDADFCLEAARKVIELAEDYIESR